MSMDLCIFLHFYQPAEQKRSVLDSIIHQCYEPLLKKMNSMPNVKLTANISGCLLELFDHIGRKDLIEDISNLVASHKLELVGSAKYHALLPLLPEDEIRRQIVSNGETLRKYLGSDLKLHGFFPPEMAIDDRVLSIISDMGYKWVILDEISLTFHENIIDNRYKFHLESSDLIVVVRNRRISNLIMSAVVRNRESFNDSISKELLTNDYYIAAMDAETFGHHRPGLENLLYELVTETQEYRSTCISETIKERKTLAVAKIASCTWASSVQDIKDNNQFLSWKDSQNEIHALQHRLFNLTLSVFGDYRGRLSSKSAISIREKLDLALASDHFWWASAKPWWSIEMIELGAFRFIDILKSISKELDDPQMVQNLIEGNSLYNEILMTSYEWQRSDKISSYLKDKNTIRIPFKDRTVGVGGAEEGVYEAFVNMMTNLEQKASKNREYEQAILWRDALYKLEHKLDIFETINAVDLVRNHISNEEVEATILKYKRQFDAIRGGQPEQRD